MSGEFSDVITSAAPPAESLATRRGIGLPPVGTKDDPAPAAAAAAAFPARKPNLWRGRLGAVVMAQRVVMTPLRKMRMRFSMRASASEANVVTEVDSEAAAAEIPLWQQGNKDLYTEEALKARANCRSHKDVLEVLQAWWEMVQRSHLPPEEYMLGKDGYCDVMLRIYKTMMEEFDADEARECAEEDWEMDRQGQNSLTRTMFCDSMFQLAGASAGRSLALALPRSPCIANQS